MRTLLLIGILATACASEGAQVGLTWAAVDGGSVTADAGGVDGARPPDKDASQDPAADTADTAPQVHADAPPQSADAAMPALDCSDTCKALGWCVPVGQACAATADTDCDTAWICQLEGKCVAKAGKCVLGNDKGCKALPGCKGKGLCTWNKTKGACVALWDADCAESDVCKVAGKCKPVNGACCDVAPDGLCKP